MRILLEKNLMKVFFGEPFSLLSFRQSLNGIQLVLIHIQEEKKIKLGGLNCRDWEQDFLTRQDKILNMSRSRVSIEILLKIKAIWDLRVLTLLRLVDTLFIDHFRLFYSWDVIFWTVMTNQDRDQDFSTHWDKVLKMLRSRVSIKTLLKIKTNEDFRA